MDTTALWLLAARSVQPPAVCWTDASTNANANQSGVTAISAAWTVPAYDAQPGTVYELEVPWDAVTVSPNTLELGLSIDASASFTPGAVLNFGSVSPNGMIRAVLQILTTGTGGTANAFLQGSACVNAVDVTLSNAAGFSATTRSKGFAIDTTVSHNLRINSLWSASNASQAVSGYGSTFWRLGR